MEPISIIKPDMAIVGQGQLGLSPFGMLSRLFEQELASRTRQQIGYWQQLPLTLLEDEEDEERQRNMPAPEIKLDLDVNVLLKALKEEQAKQQKDNKGKKEPPPAEQRIIEKVILREREIRIREEETRRVVLQNGPRRMEWRLPENKPAQQSAEVAAKAENDPQAAASGDVSASEAKRKTQENDTRTVTARRTTGERKAAEAAGPRSAVARPAKPIGGGQKRRAAMELASRAATAPAAGGWTPQWRQVHPGFPTGGEKSSPGGQQAGSIVLPDVLRRRRELAMEGKPLTDTEYLPGELQTSLEWAAQTERAEQTTAEAFTRTISRAVTRALAERERLDDLREESEFAQEAAHASVLREPVRTASRENDTSHADEEERNRAMRAPEDRKSTAPDTIREQIAVWSERGADTERQPKAAHEKPAARLQAGDAGGIAPLQTGRGSAPAIPVPSERLADAETLSLEHRETPEQGTAEYARTPETADIMGMTRSRIIESTGRDSAAPEYAESTPSAEERFEHAVMENSRTDAARAIVLDRSGQMERNVTREPAHGGPVPHNEERAARYEPERPTGTEAGRFEPAAVAGERINENSAIPVLNRAAAIPEAVTAELTYRSGQELGFGGADIAGMTQSRTAESTGETSVLEQDASASAATRNSADAAASSVDVPSERTKALTPEYASGSVKPTGAPARAIPVSTEREPSGELPLEYAESASPAAGHSEHTVIENSRTDAARVTASERSVQAGQSVTREPTRGEPVSRSEERAARYETDRPAFTRARRVEPAEAAGEQINEAADTAIPVSSNAAAVPEDGAAELTYRSGQETGFGGADVTSMTQSRTAESTGGTSVLEQDASASAAVRSSADAAANSVDILSERAKVLTPEYASDNEEPTNTPARAIPVSTEREPSGELPLEYAGSASPVAEHSEHTVGENSRTDVAQATVSNRSGQIDRSVQAGQNTAHEPARGESASHGGEHAARYESDSPAGTKAGRFEPAEAAGERINEAIDSAIPVSSLMAAAPEDGAAELTYRSGQEPGFGEDPARQSEAKMGRQTIRPQSAAMATAAEPAKAAASRRAVPVDFGDREYPEAVPLDHLTGAAEQPVPVQTAAADQTASQRARANRQPQKTTQDAVGKLAHDIRIAPPERMRRETKADPGASATEESARMSVKLAAPVERGDALWDEQMQLTYAQAIRVGQEPAAPSAGNAPNAGQALPEWAQRLLNTPGKAGASASSGKTIRFGLTGEAAAAASAGMADGQTVWTAPYAIPTSTANASASRPAEMVFHEKGEDEEQDTSVRRTMDERELRKTADKVYRMIEDRLRKELRRNGR